MDSRELFETAIAFVLAHEGGFVDHPDDAGGPTNFGISSHHNPDVDVRRLTREEAVEIYWTKYWDGHGFDLLPLEIAVKVFDLAVNLGDCVAVTCLQRALRACHHPVNIDGILGPQTAAAADEAPHDAALAAIRSEAAGEYRLRVVRHMSQATFAAGWLNRAYA